MDRQEEEIQLVQDILDGESHHYEVLVDRYAPMVFSVVNRFVKSDADTEELAQQIFVKTYERLSSFKGDSKFSSWLYMIAMNHCKDYAKNIRRQNKNFNEVDDHVLHQKMDQHEAADAAIENAEWNNLIKKGLDEINDKYSKAFLMKYESDMTYQAMSQRLGTSVSALKVRVYRAKKQLKDFVEQNG
ncbi:RNA polymerase, sigma subunit, ECF family [Fodinibius salinus]|uniref:RNA polymerase, sigma subunit, ECF family n=1 Tax=Fodinibius salinus TaxID=860790 RepID=A0A5D3YN34_9BACT|nr:sigma-70 family RNA polymerase sigma factor [Fodinibius salinus]TYP95274.1 RNA polymerase, sigma subunit, ECF family [Fodinibius salinus]